MAARRDPRALTRQLAARYEAEHDIVPTTRARADALSYVFAFVCACAIVSAVIVAVFG